MRIVGGCFDKVLLCDMLHFVRLGLLFCVRRLFVLLRRLN